MALYVNCIVSDTCRYTGREMQFLRTGLAGPVLNAAADGDSVGILQRCLLRKKNLNDVPIRRRKSLPRAALSIGLQVRVVFAFITVADACNARTDRLKCKYIVLSD